MWVVVSVVIVVVLLATYITLIAGRVDRLHARAAAAYSALDAQSMRRAALAAELGERESVPELQEAAKLVLVAPMEGREPAENALTKALRTAGTKLEPATMAGAEEANRRLALARQVHTDLTRDALAVRRRRLVRLLRLGRRHPHPAFFDIDEPTLD